MSVLVLAVVALALARYGPGALRQLLGMARLFWKSRAIPGPAEGVLRFLTSPSEELIHKVHETTQRYGGVVRVWAPPVVCIFITDPEDLEVMYGSPHVQVKPAIVYDSVSPILGKGMATLSGSEHRKHRKSIGPSLHLEILQGFVPIFEQNAQILCKGMDSYAATATSFDVMPLLGRCSAQAIVETVYSAEVTPGLKDEQERFIRVLMDSSELIFYRLTRPWYANDTLFRLSPNYDKYMEAVKGFDLYVSKMLAHKKDMVKRGVGPKEGKRKAFLDHFLTSDEAHALTESELVESLKTLSAGAVGTSMDLMSFFMVLIATNPDVQDKIVKELDDVFGGSDRPVEASDLSHLNYLECVIKETLRMYPPLFAFSRNVKKDVPLPSGHVLPEGSIVTMLPYMTHRNPKYFPDPEKFDPSRFSPENSRDRHPYAYIPFSAGPRNCIGQRYAMMSAKVIAATVLRKFRVLLCPNGPQKISDFKMSVGVTFGFKYGANIRVERRVKSDLKRRG
ncbi:Cytochrome P450 4V2 [Frankliniella fusca]|uniref:Cytochrome P450 4V2 n=1 Tax=Frankliniella fusca TaxID=407009 RepID=A0AAE1HDJ6_9NEOP|nr:Cytochrome P450 4V2 [Frankliniella fusca]